MSNSFQNMIPASDPKQLRFANCKLSTVALYKAMHAGQGPVGPMDHGSPEPPKTSPGSPQEPRTPWQNIGRAKLKRLAKYQQIPSGFVNSTSDVNFSTGLRPAGRRSDTLDKDGFLP